MITKKYIKVLEKSKEIQKLWEPIIFKEIKKIQLLKGDI